MRAGQLVVVVSLAPWFGRWFAGYRRRVDEGMEPDPDFVQFMIRLAITARPGVPGSVP